jgi:hydroxyethylthiazole kinase-like uncharacterized protein yjeF
VHMEILTVAEMKKVDEETIDRFCPGLELMERAGRNIAELILDMYGSERLKAVIFVGAGNNGGDALVAARYLAEKECSCSVHLLKSPDEISLDALKNYKRLSKLMKRERGIREFDTSRPDWPKLVEKDLADATLIIDGLFGTGVRGPLKGKALDIVQVINASVLPVISVDVPSGVDGDTGRVPGEAVRASYTVTMGRPKLGLLFHPGKAYTGEMIVADLGFPDEVVRKHSSGLILLDVEEAARRTPLRMPDTYKYECGTLLIVAGSRSFTGAAVLAGEAALRGGCGMVFVGVPEGVRSIVESGTREAITIPLPETEDGTTSLKALALLEPYIGRADAIAVGPGMGRNQETDAFIETLVTSSPLPIVLDADGITAFAGRSERLRDVNSPLVVTPHSGELKRLLAKEISRTPSEKIEQTRSIAKELGIVLLHKGAPSMIASRDGHVLINLHGNSSLATGGSGDVLTGLVGSRCKLSPR